LMAYIVDPECRVIHMITHKQTAKYRNMTGNPSVCLLIDTRAEDTGTRRGQARALTVKGLFESMGDEQQKCDIRARLLERHPHLGEFASDPEAEVFSVRIASLQLLEGVSDSSYVRFD
ncbi:MAG: pyridoxamine 5'-phosphate oxidase family protein, partial [Syntrophobacteria bacterium]